MDSNCLQLCWSIRRYRHERVRSLHPPSGAGLASALFVSKRLLGFEEYGVLSISIDNRHAEYLNTLLHGNCAARPEPVNAWSLLARLGDVTRIDGDCNAMSFCRFQEQSVERKTVERLLEVLAEPALTLAATPRHLGEVESSGMCKYKFHCFDEGGLKRFA